MIVVLEFKESASMSDKTQFPIGISDFKEVVQGNCIFVDKTMLIKEVVEDQAKVILMTRPRRFGKTLNMSMLYYFLSNTQHNIFKDLQISKEIDFCKAHHK
jgi:hypothetical protein